MRTHAPRSLELPVGIDIAPNGIFVVRLLREWDPRREAYRAIIAGFGSSSIVAHADSALGRIVNGAETRHAIKAAFAQAGGKSGMSCVLSLAPEQAVVLRIKMPPMPARQVPHALRFVGAQRAGFDAEHAQLPKYRPAGPGQYVCDIIHAPRVDARQEIVQAALPGVRLVGTDAEAAAMQRALPTFAGAYDSRRPDPQLIVFHEPDDERIAASPYELARVLSEQRVNMRRFGHGPPKIALLGALSDAARSACEDVRDVEVIRLGPQPLPADALAAYGLAQWHMADERPAA